MDHFKKPSRPQDNDKNEELEDADQTEEEAQAGSPNNAPESAVDDKIEFKSGDENSNKDSEDEEAQFTNDDDPGDQPVSTNNQPDSPDTAPNEPETEDSSDTKPAKDSKNSKPLNDPRSKANTEKDETKESSTGNTEDHSKAESRAGGMPSEDTKNEQDSNPSQQPEPSKKDPHHQRPRDKNPAGDRSEEDDEPDTDPNQPIRPYGATKRHEEEEEEEDKELETRGGAAQKSQASAQQNKNTGNAKKDVPGGGDGKAGGSKGGSAGQKKGGSGGAGGSGASKVGASASPAAALGSAAGEAAAQMGVPGAGAAQTVVKSAVKIKLLIAGIVALKPIAIVGLIVTAVMVFLMAFGEADEALGNIRTATSEGGIDQDVNMAYFEAAVNTGAPWALIAAIGEMSTRSGTQVPGETIRRGFDADTSLAPTLEPKIEVELADENKYYGIFLFSEEYVNKDRTITGWLGEQLERFTPLDYFDPQSVEASANEVGLILRRYMETEVEGGFDETVRWDDPEFKDMWIEAIKQLPISGNAEMPAPPPPPANNAVTCAPSGEDLIIVGDSLTVGVETWGDFCEETKFIAEVGWSFNNGLSELEDYLFYSPEEEEEADEEAENEETPSVSTSSPNNYPEDAPINNENMMTIVIHLGTNGWGGNAESMLNRITHIINSRPTLSNDNNTSDGDDGDAELSDSEVPAIRVVMINPRDPSLNGYQGAEYITDVRTKISNFGATFSSSPVLKVADATSWTSEPGTDFAADKLHPTTDGYKKLAAWISNQIGTTENVVFTNPMLPFAERVYGKAIALEGGVPNISVARIQGVPDNIMEAYSVAAEWAQQTIPECNIPVTYIAAIGWKESRHATGVDYEPPSTSTRHAQNRTVDASGRLDPPFYGQRTTNSWTQYSTTPSAGNYMSPEDISFFNLHPGDGFSTRALGLMQQMPRLWKHSTGEVLLEAGHAGGRPDPQNIFDAAKGAAAYLCRTGMANGEYRDLTADEDALWASAGHYFSGNTIGDAGRAYADSVLEKKKEYDGLIQMFNDGNIGNSRGVQRMMQWANMQKGSCYVAMNPWRFGVVYDGVPREDIHGTVRHCPSGVRVFDCSGFSHCAYRQVGINIPTSTAQLVPAIRNGTNGLMEVQRHEAQPGDIIVWVGHVMLSLGGDRAIHSSPGCNSGSHDKVCETTVNWTRPGLVVGRPVNGIPSDADPLPGGPCAI